MEAKRKVCVVTAARSEYGLLRWTLHEMAHSQTLQPQLVVTGSHLAVEQGHTIDAIRADGFPIDRCVEMELATDTATAIARSMGRCAEGMADAFEELQPDLLLVLGDRYELLPIGSTALVMGIPIAHLSGGDRTEGAIDNRIRNALTMMASLHLPGTEESARRIRRMTGGREPIHPVGEPGLENFLRCEPIPRTVLAKELELDLSKRWVLLTLHPETLASPAYNRSLAENLLTVLDAIDDIQVIVTHANADLGGLEINRLFRAAAEHCPQRYRLFPSLGQTRYLSLMREAWVVAGNSSSGIVEAPFIGRPAIDVGDRQKGRHRCPSVLHAENSPQPIAHAFQRLRGLHFAPNRFWGDGHTSQRIVQALESFLQ